MGWISSNNGPGNPHWVYNNGGMQRDNSVQGSQYKTLVYGLSSSHLFKSGTTYQYEVSTKGDLVGIGLSASFSWSNGVYSGFRYDSIVGQLGPAVTKVRYFFHTVPSVDTSGTYSIYLMAKGNFSGNGSTDPRITDIKISEIDWIMSGTKRFDYSPPGNTIDDTQYDGWIYEDDIDTFWWQNNISSTMGATGLSINGDYSTNYIAKYVSYKYYNLTFVYETPTFTLGDYIKIETAPSLTSTTRTTLFTLTQSGSPITHEVQGISGGGYIFFVGSISSGVFQSKISNIKIEGGYNTYTNNQFLFTDYATYSNPTTLQILGTMSANGTYSFVIGTGSTIDGSLKQINTISTQFGNGTFKAGIWENGVWNSGWRVDTEVHEFDNVGIAFRTISDKRWRIQLSGPKSSTSAFNIGDKISIGNIVAIDINENRKLFKGYFTVINKSDTALIIETDANFPYRRIEKDSPNHKIKVTKNIWLSGAFLNGYYTGVWNYGLFKGYPRITEMFDTHWIDGTFDGGHFNSIYEKSRFTDTIYVTASVYGLDTSFEGKLGLSYSIPHGYEVGDIINIDKDNKTWNPGYDGIANITYKYDDYIVFTDKVYASSSVHESGTSSNTKANGLIQNFTFFDNNIGQNVANNSIISLNPFANIFQFNSWIDVNYYDTSAVNIGKPVLSYDSLYNLEYSKNNLYGYPTNDILSSESSFRDSYSFNIRRYKLGTKYKIYSDGIGNASNFSEPFDMNLIGLESFINNGWTFSGTHSTYQRSLEINDPSITNDDYIIKGEELIMTSTMSGSVLNNTNISIEKNRYTVVEMDIKTYSIASSTYTAAVGSTGIGGLFPIPVLNFSNINQDQYNIPFLGLYYVPSLYLPINKNINHLLTPGTKKYEYFFNKRKLSMKLLGSDDTNTSQSSSITIDNLKYYEIDMIPFFQYFIESNIYKGVSIPWQGIAPFIDYTNSNFSFIDNISIGLLSFYTSQSFTPIGNNNSGNTSGSVGGLFIGA